MAKVQHVYNGSGMGLMLKQKINWTIVQNIGIFQEHQDNIDPGLRTQDQHDPLKTHSGDIRVHRALAVAMCP